MDITKVTAAVVLAQTELANAITSERKVLADPKADVDALAAASNSLRIAGKINAILTSAAKRIEKRVAPKAKRVKKAVADAKKK
jgi:hypothetical protein